VLEGGLGFGHVRNLFTQKGNPTLLHSLAHSPAEAERAHVSKKEIEKGAQGTWCGGGGRGSEKGRGSVCLCFCLQDLGFRMQDGGLKNDETFVHQKHDSL
jgi:hypothetical protein